MTTKYDRFVKLLNDEPTLEDLLDRAPLVRQVAESVATCDAPQVFGLHGDWGSGKTSFLQQLRWSLVGEPTGPAHDGEDGKWIEGLVGAEFREQTTVVWFEAWRYQHEKAPIVALLHEIRSQLPWSSKALEKTKKLADVAVRSALLSLEDLTKRIGIQASKIQAAGEKWEADHLATQLPSDQIRQHLQHTLAKLLPGTAQDAAADEPAHRLVIVIDDLDRCEAETAYRLLEGIKIYLNLPNCVFVLGMNQRILEGAVAQHLPEAVEEPQARRRMAKRYLEKLCQNVWHLPLVREPWTLLDRYLGDDFQRKPQLSSVVARYRCLPLVPRKIKGFANLLRRSEKFLDGCHAAQQDTDEESLERWAKLVVLVCYLYQFHHEIYRVLSHQPSFYDELVGWCRGRETRADEFMEDTLGLTRREELLPSDETQSPEEAMEDYAPVYDDPATDRILHVEGLIRDFEDLKPSELTFALRTLHLEDADA